MADACLLIGDIGGTNARFALAHPDEPGFSGELTLHPQPGLLGASYCARELYQQKAV